MLVRIVAAESFSTGGIDEECWTALLDHDLAGRTSSGTFKR
jgi:hypothetical protein